MYKVLLTDKAVKNLNKLDSNTSKIIKSKLLEYSKEPFNYARKLSKTSIGTYRFRVGDYRIIFDIDKDNIVVLKIGHRKEIYR